jgi:hypothetical protein
VLAGWRAAADYPAGPNNVFAHCRFFRAGCRARLTTSNGGTRAAAGHAHPGAVITEGITDMDGSSLSLVAMKNSRCRAAAAAPENPVCNREMAFCSAEHDALPASRAA